MKVAEIIARVRALYNKGQASDDSKLSDRFIYAKVGSARALLIKREIDKKRQVSDWIVQTIKCFELEPAKINECPCAVPPGCNVLKSINKVPKPIQSAIGPELEFVTTMDGDTLYSKTNWVKRRYKEGDKYTKHKPEYLIKDDYLFLIQTKKLLKFITIGGVFENPIDAAYADTCSNLECTHPYDQEFPIDGHLIDAVIQMASQELLQIFKAIPSDVENNATEDTGAGVPPQQPRQQQR
jgi:hypothetical protein